MIQIELPECQLEKVMVFLSGHNESDVVENWILWSCQSMFHLAIKYGSKKEGKVSVALSDSQALYLARFLSTEIENLQSESKEIIAQEEFLLYESMIVAAEALLQMITKKGEINE